MANDTLYTDKELFNLIAGGDERAFGILFHRFVPRIEPVIAKLTGSAEVTKDLVQDIFLGLWLDRARLSDIGSPPDWIFRIVYNKTYGWLEKTKNREHIRMELAVSGLGLSIGNPTEESVSFSETARLVKEAIRALPPQMQRVYRLSREQGLSGAEIAAQLGLSPHTVRNTLVSAARSIRGYLAERGIILPLVLIIFWVS